MDNNWEKRFFECIRSAYEGKFQFSEEKTDDKDALNIVFDLGEDDGTIPYEGTVTVDDNGDDETACVDLLIVFRDGIPAEKMNDAVKLVSCFNSVITIGFFGIFEDTGCVYYNCSFGVIAKDDAAYYESALRVFNETARTAVVSVGDADDCLERFISGDATYDELIAEGAAVIQEIGPEDDE